MSNIDINKLLEDAINDLDEEPSTSTSSKPLTTVEADSVSKATSTSSAQPTQSSSDANENSAVDEETIKQFQELMTKMSSGQLSDADPAKTMEQLMSLLQQPTQPTTQTQAQPAATSDSSMDGFNQGVQMAKAFLESGSSGSNDPLMDAIKNISSSAKTQGGSNNANLPPFGMDPNNPNATAEMDKLFSQLLTDFEKAGLGGNGAAGDAGDMGGMDQMIESMMSAMLSKEALYPHVQEICAKYPKWLEDNKSKVSEADLKNYTKQLECYKQICVIFETTPEDTKTVAALMQEMQQYGQPPQEIMAAILPEGTQFDDKGNPVPNFGAAGGPEPNMPPMDEEMMKEMMKNLSNVKPNDCPQM